MEKTGPRWSGLIAFGLWTAVSLGFMGYMIRGETLAGRGLPWRGILGVLPFVVVGIAGIARSLKGKELMDPPKEGYFDR